MGLHDLAGRKAPAEILVNVEKLLQEYEVRQPDLSDPAQRVSFGTSGHRGTSFNGSFTDAHIAAITQAIVEYRGSKGITGPLYMGRDTHALSSPAQNTAIEVLAANGVTTIIHGQNRATPTPVVSHAILTQNRGRTSGLADGVVITPSHNPPEDGGFKYNGTNGGPADTDATSVIQDRANEILAGSLKAVKRLPLREAMASGHVTEVDLISPYVNDLGSIIDMDVIRTSGLSIGVDPLGGSSHDYWEPIAKKYGINLKVVNPIIDPQFGFMTLDHDGKIRMDCSSPCAMASLVSLKDKYGIAFANDPDADRHGIVTPTGGLMNPNSYLAVCIQYLFQNRKNWSASAGVGKTLVSSAMIDRVAAAIGRKLVEVPVGFKWFVDGLYDGSLGFGGEESAGASFLRKDGSVWTTDKDGLILGLLAAEITAATGKDPSQHFAELAAKFGVPEYTRIDQVATLEQKAILKKLSPDDVKATMLAGDPITQRLTAAPGNGAAIGGLKVSTDFGWFAARPSGTENVYKIYAESFRDLMHLGMIVSEAKEIVSAALSKA